MEPTCQPLLIRWTVLFFVCFFWVGDGWVGSEWWLKCDTRMLKAFTSRNSACKDPWIDIDQISIWHVCNRRRSHVLFYLGRVGITNSLNQPCICHVNRRWQFGSVVPQQMGRVRSVLPSPSGFQCGCYVQPASHQNEGWNGTRSHRWRCHGSTDSHQIWKWNPIITRNV